MKENDLIKSPLNYTGNKYRLIEQMKQYFPQKIKIMVDLFCGGATVGLNTTAEKIYFIDSNPRVIGLLVYLAKQDFEKFLLKLEKKIEYFNLSYSFKNGYKYYRNSYAEKDNNGLKHYNTKGYYELRECYNKIENKDSDDANLLLYLLLVYSFNNDLRFNSDGLFNLPVGKTDLNKMNVEKLRNYITRVNSIDCEFLCLNFEDKRLKSIVKKADFIYMDPPYLITDAVYNTSWNNEKEYSLLKFIEKLMGSKKNFALSNVLEKTDKRNEPLYYWCHNNIDYINIYDLNYNYRSSSYNKKNRESKEREVLITNRSYVDED